jgi:hypothetical protein
MKTIKIILFSFFVVFLTDRACNAQRTLKDGQTFTSPDNRYSLKLIADASNVSAIDGFIITNNGTGEEFQDVLPPPVYWIKWSQDSETIVFIVHVAGGSLADIYTLRNNKWINYTPEPTVGDHYAVIGQHVGNHTVALIYKVGDKAAGRFYVYSFVFHPDTAARSDVRIHEIDIETYRKLQFKGG